MPPVAPPLPTVLVLASGKGERFRASGGRVHKLQADLCGRSVLDRTLDAVRASGLPWHLEDAGHPGMGDSVAAAVRATRHAPGWLMLPADLPLIAAATLVSVARTLMAGTAMAVLPWVGAGAPIRSASRARWVRSCRASKEKRARGASFHGWML